MATKVTNPNANEVHYTASADITPGGLIERDGKVWHVEGLSPIKSGDAVNARRGIVVELDAASALVVAAGAQVGYQDSDRTGLAAGAGDFDAGVCVGGKANGETKISVRLD